jgi:acyl-CoA oxidase
VQSLETTATLDKNTDEIILNTPTISAAKYWPGDLGVFANYAMQPMPNIELGDIGPKFGFFTKDNGYMLMKNVRIPRTNMLSRYVGVNK